MKSSRSLPCVGLFAPVSRSVMYTAVPLVAMNGGPGLGALMLLLGSLAPRTISLGILRTVSLTSPSGILALMEPVSTYAPPSSRSFNASLLPTFIPGLLRIASVFSWTDSMSSFDRMLIWPVGILPFQAPK